MGEILAHEKPEEWRGYKTHTLLCHYLAGPQLNRLSMEWLPIRTHRFRGQSLRCHCTNGATNVSPSATAASRYVADGFTKLNRPKLPVNKLPVKNNCPVVSKSSDCMNYRYRADRLERSSDVISGLIFVLVLLAGLLVWLMVELLD